MTNDKLFSLPSGSYLLVSHVLLKELDQYRQVENTKVEQGGMLFGVLRSLDKSFSIESPPHIEILDASFPDCDDIATRISFKRISKAHLDKLSKLKNDSRSAICYLGEWHTHPECKPRPSSTDLASWRKAFIGKMAIVVILGIECDWWGYWAQNRVVKLEEVIH
jgi:integrative and conjugative element protein (TIGR02256 family)